MNTILETLNYLDYIGTLVFAISGAMAASNKKLDLFGASFIALMTAVGGGTVRDLLLGQTPVSWMQDVNYLYVILTGVTLTFLLQRFLVKLTKTLFLFDAIGISVFTILGLQKALILDLHPIVAVMMGMFSAVLGGVIRDTLINRIPLIFRKEIYAMACIAGASFFLLMDNLGLYFEVNATICILLIIVIRMASVKFHISLPTIDSFGK